jgi:hypothetical protein
MKPSLAKGHNNNNVLHGNYERKPRYAILVNDMLNDFIHGDQELNYAQKFLCTLYSMTDGLVEEQRDMLDVLEYISISSLNWTCYNCGC